MEAKIRWTTAQIRAARHAPLQPLLQRLGYRLTPTGGDNYKLLLPAPVSKTLLIKAHFWRCPQDDSAGNAVDFFIKVQGLSFHHAMQAITASLAES